MLSFEEFSLYVYECPKIYFVITTHVVKVSDFIMLKVLC